MQTVAAPDGTEIAFESEGAGAPLVLVHGTTADRSRWAPIRPALARTFTTVAVDRRGRGDSGDTPEYGIEREFADVAAVVDSVGPGALFGHSYGALCALGAAMLSDKARRLVLYEPPIGIGAPPGVIEELERLLDAGDRAGVVSTFLSRVPRLPDNEIKLLQSLPMWAARVAAAHTLPREIRAAEVFVPDPAQVGALAVPVLLLVGGDSPAPMQAASEKLASLLPDATTVVMPGQQHAALDTAPEMVIEAVTEFLGAD